MDRSPRPKRITTGIAGLDVVLDGGFIEGGVYLVQGPPGSGKTILANQLCFHQAGSGRKVLYVTLLTESHGRMLSHLRRMAFFRPELVGDTISYLAGFKILDEEGLPGLLAALRTATSDGATTLVVLDGLVTAGDATSSRMVFKRFVHELQLLATHVGATAILLSTLEGGPEAQARVTSEHSIVDGIIVLSDDLSGSRSLRHLEVTKMRGAGQVRGRHSVEISEAGLTIHPRFEAWMPHDGLEGRPSSGHRMTTGIERLDEMLHGGLPRGSLSMLVGPTGCGKTIMGLQFLAAGAAKGERGLYFGFYERPAALLAKCARINIDLQASVDAGLIEMVWERPIEGVLDELAQHLMRRLRDGGMTRLCIDGLHSLRRTVDYPERTRSVTGALAELLERLHVSTVFTLEIPKVLGDEVTIPIDDLSAISHNILLMRYLETWGRCDRTLTVLKMRDSDFDRSVVALEIEDAGIQLRALGEAHDPRAHRRGPRKRRTSP